MASNWSRLFEIACSLIDQVNAEFPVIDEWTFGGGTALMLRVGHRLSHDIDIFIEDSQLLAYLDPAKADFQLNVPAASYQGDGTTFRKFAFPGLGEIDFIVAHQLTPRPFTEMAVSGRTTLVETVGEIVAKKIFYRGARITPRDIFDIAASAEGFRQEVELALSQFPDKVKRAIAAIERENRSYIDAVIDDLDITGDFARLKSTSVDTALDVLRSALSKHP